MITILSAVVCLKAVCYQVTVPTPTTMAMDSCMNSGGVLARRYIDHRWTVREIQCQSGRDV